MPVFEIMFVAVGDQPVDGGFAVCTWLQPFGPRQGEERGAHCSVHALGLVQHDIERQLLGAGFVCGVDRVDLLQRVAARF